MMPLGQCCLLTLTLRDVRLACVCVAGIIVADWARQSGRAQYPLSAYSFFQVGRLRNAAGQPL